MKKKSIDELFRKLIKKNFTVASVESFTGGLFASTIISKANAGKIFKGGLITYDNKLKEKLGVDISNGVINKNVALEMAKCGKKYFEVDYCISFTGNAGPSGTEEKEIGNIFIAINDFVFEFNIRNKNRNQIRKKAVELAIDELNKII